MEDLPSQLGRDTILPARDDYPERYAAGVAEAARRDLTALRERLAAWRYLAPDAVETAISLSEAGFRRFARDLLRERAGCVPAGTPLRAEWVTIQLPASMFVVSVAAARLRAPFGTAFHRMLADGMLLEHAGAVRPASGALRALLGSFAPLASLRRASRPMVPGSGTALRTYPATT